jgi:methyl-accepting chemotaxis protein
LKRLSIRNKLMLSMAFCLLLFLVVSATLSVVMTGNTIRERVVTQELPAEVGEIRNDIQRQISVPLAAARAIAANTFLLNWEKAGLPDSGQDAWRRLRHAPLTGAARCRGCRRHRQILRPQGYKRTLDKSATGDQWFYGFLATGKPYTLNLDKEKGYDTYSVFVNVRFDAGDGKIGTTSVGWRSTSWPRPSAATRWASPALCTWCGRTAR